jgi:hypothetical protein
MVVLILVHVVSNQSNARDVYQGKKQQVKTPTTKCIIPYCHVVRIESVLFCSMLFVSSSLTACPQPTWCGNLTTGKMMHHVGSLCDDQSFTQLVL